MITVLMSTYNGEKYLREQLDSILNQENVDVFLFIRDDGSKDSTVNILSEYKTKYSNVEFYTDENIGVAMSFYQLILDAPKSEYYAFADQDDVWDSNKLYHAVSILENNGDDIPALYCSGTRPVDKELNIIPYKKAKPINPTFGIALTQAIAPGCSYVFNSNLLNEFKKLGINNVDIHDWALFRVATALDSYIYYDINPLFSYRQHENNVIGARRSFIGHWIGRFNRFFNKDYRNIRSIMARKIKEAYYYDMSDANKKDLDIFVNYDSNFMNKLKLVKTKNIGMIKKTDNLIFKILVLIGRV